MVSWSGLTAVARGETERPEGLADDAVWEDTDPLRSRQITLIIFVLFILFQIIFVIFVKLPVTFAYTVPIILFMFMFKINNR